MTHYRVEIERDGASFSACYEGGELKGTVDAGRVGVGRWEFGLTATALRGLADDLERLADMVEQDEDLDVYDQMARAAR